MFCKEFINKFFIKKGLQNQTSEPNKRISNDEVKAQVKRYSCYKIQKAFYAIVR